MSKLKCITGHEHVYQIVKGSGKIHGVSLWKCLLCGKVVKSM